MSLEFLFSCGITIAFKSGCWNLSLPESANQTPRPFNPALPFYPGDIEPVKTILWKAGETSGGLERAQLGPRTA
jgi:hypothetical protein